MPKEVVNPPELFASLPYGFSQINTSGGGKTVFLSGQVGWDGDQVLVGDGTMRDQVFQTCRNIEIAMRAAGGSLRDVVSLRIYLVGEDSEEDRHISDALKQFFPADSAPTATWVRVSGLARQELLVEIEATAVLEE